MLPNGQGNMEEEWNARGSSVAAVRAVLGRLAGSHKSELGSL